MRRASLLFAILVVVPLLGSDSPKEYDDKTETGIDGTWRLVGYENNVMTCHSGTWTIDDGNGETWRGTYRIDTTRKPPHLDRFCGAPKGSTVKLLYQIDRDVLRIAYYGPSASQRPQGFNDEGVQIATYKRVR